MTLRDEHVQAVNGVVGNMTPEDAILGIMAIVLLAASVLLTWWVIQLLEERKSR